MRLIMRSFVFIGILTALAAFSVAVVYAQVLGEVTVNKVNVRDAGSVTDSNVLYMVNAGQPLEITGVEGDYYQVNLGTDIGVYIASEYVRITHDDSLSIRIEPEVNAEAPLPNIGMSDGSGYTADAAAPLNPDHKAFTEVAPEQTPLAEAALAETVLADQVIAYAKEFLGIGYRFGGSSPENGFDCSGFVSYVLAHFDISVERSSGDMAAQGVAVDREALQKGDLLFFATAGGRSISHVGIYIGDQRLIHATDWGGGVEISDLNEEYYVESYVKASRVL